MKQEETKEGVCRSVWLLVCACYEGGFLLLRALNQKETTMGRDTARINITV